MDSWWSERIDRALHERNFTFLADLIRKADLPSEVRDRLATVILGLLKRLAEVAPNTKRLSGRHERSLTR
jgi:hypothetical protein